MASGELHNTDILRTTWRLAAGTPAPYAPSFMITKEKPPMRMLFFRDHGHDRSWLSGIESSPLLLQSSPDECDIEPVIGDPTSHSSRRSVGNTERQLEHAASIPAVSGWALRPSSSRLSTCTRACFYAFDVGRGFATTEHAQLRSQPRHGSVSMRSMSGGVLRQAGKAAEARKNSTQFLCPRCRAGFCDL